MVNQLCLLDYAVIELHGNYYYVRVFSISNVKSSINTTPYIGVVLDKAIINDDKEITGNIIFNDADVEIYGNYELDFKPYRLTIDQKNEKIDKSLKELKENVNIIFNEIYEHRNDI